ncbi:MAG TPA: LLM class flavin-dependent oxidoreductase, partial [Albitalea sp.]|nr:LLM class flavin-dependent oxidoreductase [Albitalea sp.]
PLPQATLCVWALAAETEDEALHHALSRERWRVDRQRGIFGPLQAPDEVAAQGFGDADRPIVDSMRRKAFVGSAAQVADKLRALAARFEMDELVVNTWAHDPQVRRRSYALLARHFEL